MRNQAHPNWRWGPMLVEVEGERVRVLAGLAMRMRLLQILGPVRALRVAQAMTCGAQMASPSRMQPLLLSFLILLTMLLFSHNAFAYSVCCKRKRRSRGAAASGAGPGAGVAGDSSGGPDGRPGARGGLGKAAAVAAGRRPGMLANC